LALRFVLGKATKNATKLGIRAGYIIFFEDIRANASAQLTTAFKKIEKSYTTMCNQVQGLSVILAKQNKVH
jgi:hypothetical protein